MNLPNLLAHQARKFPKKEAIITPQDRLTYTDWDMYVNRFAHALLENGINPGDKIVLHLPNTKEFLFSYIAAQRIGALPVPINARLVHQEILYIVEHSDAKLIITHELLFEQVKDLNVPDLKKIKTGEADQDWLSFDSLIESAPSTEISCALTEDDEASILYTSGTTGKPKGVVFTYRNILSVATMICIEMPMNLDSRVLHMMPLSHSAPLHLFMATGLYVGATHVLVPTFSPDLLLETVQKEKITHFFGAPVAYLATSKHPEVSNYDLSSMEYWVYGGAPLSKEEVLFVKEQFSTDKLVCVYGLTEAGPSGTLLSTEDQTLKAGSIGKRAALGTEIRIVDKNGKDVGQGEIGEIILHGEGNMKKYYKDEENTKDSLRDDWLYTGDMAKQDEDGYYWVVDRKKDIIISGGTNIYPKEIENILITHPSISDVAIVGVPNPDWGETVKAFVVLDEKIENLDQSLQDFLKDKIASYKIPRIYTEMDALPRNATGKLLKTQLKQPE